MENSTKALIVAGSVLIAVLFASLAVTLFSGARDYTENNQNQMVTADILRFNAEFDVYFGANKSKSTAQNLLRKIEANNANADTVYISCNIGLSDLDDASPSTKYTISGTNNSDGYINHIEIN